MQPPRFRGDSQFEAMLINSVRLGRHSLGVALWIFHRFHGKYHSHCLVHIDITLEYDTDLQLPGLGYLYSGLTRRKNALSILFLTMASLAIVSFQWWLIGSSLVFSQGGGFFLGDGA
jgi:hypothetical protein